MADIQLAVTISLGAVAAAQAVALVILSKRVAQLTATTADVSDKLLNALMSNQGGFRELKIKVAEAQSDSGPQIGHIGPDPVPENGLVVKYPS